MPLLAHRLSRECRLFDDILRKNVRTAHEVHVSFPRHDRSRVAGRRHLFFARLFLQLLRAFDQELQDLAGSVIKPNSRAADVADAIARIWVTKPPRLLRHR